MKRGHKAHFKSIQEELKGVFFEGSILGGNCLNSKEEDRGISGLCRNLVVAFNVQ